jgi:hypothetical protein
VTPIPILTQYGTENLSYTEKQDEEIKGKKEIQR